MLALACRSALDSSAGRVARRSRRGIALRSLVVSAAILLCMAPAALAQLSFSDPTDFATGVRPYSVAVGDLDGDGNPDLAVANEGSANVSVLLGDGSGGFGPATNFAAGASPVSVAVGDVDGDGDLDLATANPNSDDASVLLGDGSGSFGPATTYDVGPPAPGSFCCLYAPYSVAVGDLDGDGNADPAVANPGSSDVSVLLGDGSGGFGAPTRFAAGDAPASVAVGDLDGDGNPDLATANNNSDDVSVLLGDGSGGFGAATSFAAGETPVSVAVGDLDGDGDPDLAVANVSDNVSVLLGNGSGGFGAPTSFAAGDVHNSVAMGDLDGDGNPDLAVNNQLSDNVSVLLGDGSGGFGAATNFSVGDAPVWVAVGDLDGNGKRDLAVANVFSDNVSVLLNTTGASADADGDGILDAVDPDPGTASNAFSDGAGTSGSITDRAGLDVTVEDVAAPDGVRITVGAGAGQVSLSVCGGFTLRVAPGSEVVVSCGSVKVEVVEGSAEVVLGGGLTVVSVPEGVTARVSQGAGGSFSVENLDGGGTLTVTVDGVETTVGPGQSKSVTAFDFRGFLAPVDNPSVLNVVEAGRVVPFAFRIVRANGTPVTTLRTASVTAAALSCSAGTSRDRIELTVPFATGLIHLGQGFYVLNWRSPTGFARSCRKVQLNLGEGVTRDAYFEFTR